MRLSIVCIALLLAGCAGPAPAPEPVNDVVEPSRNDEIFNAFEGTLYGRGVNARNCGVVGGGSNLMGATPVEFTVPLNATVIEGEATWDALPGQEQLGFVIGRDNTAMMGVGGTSPTKWLMPVADDADGTRHWVELGNARCMTPGPQGAGVIVYEGLEVTLTISFR